MNIFIVIVISKRQYLIKIDELVTGYDNQSSIYNLFYKHAKKLVN